jgi:hypothetical protein
MSAAMPAVAARIWPSVAPTARIAAARDRNARSLASISAVSRRTSSSPRICVWILLITSAI